MNASPKIESFWQTYLDSLPEQARHFSNSYGIWYFGDTPEVAETCAKLVKAGIKTATSGLVWEMEADSDALPQPGDQAVVTDLCGEPYCVIELTECVVRPFAE